MELAYASTAHGVQGDTVPAAHVVIGEHTGAASAYVGMTRGRTLNTAHVFAEKLDEARAQWIAVFGRDRVDLGPGHAAELAAGEAAHYAAPRPLEQILADLHESWTAEQRCLTRLAVLQPMRDALRELIPLHQEFSGQLAALAHAHRQAETAARLATERAAASESLVAADAGRIRGTLVDRWDSDRDTARAAATVVLGGPGRFGLRRPALYRAAEQLTDWANRWRPHLPDLPTDPGQLAHGRRPANRPALQAALDAAARGTAEDAHPEHATLRAAAHAAQHAQEQARRAVAEAGRRLEDEVGEFGALGRTPNPGPRGGAGRR